MKHSRVAEMGTLLVGVPLALVAAFTCMQLICLLGVMPNTSIFGASVALGVGRLLKHRFRHSSRQNLIQTLVSGAGFAGASSVLVATALVFVFGYPHLVRAMFLGSLVGIMADIYLGYRLFGLGLLPPQGPWPQGYATAAVLRLQDETGDKVRRLGIGVGLGLAGGILGLPTMAVGMGFLGDGLTMFVLGLGMLAGGLIPWSSVFPGRDVAVALMVGAGIVQLGQILRSFPQRGEAGKGQMADWEGKVQGHWCAASIPDSSRPKWWLYLGLLLPFVLGSLLLAVTAGLGSRLGPRQLLLFLIYTPLAALLSSLCVGKGALLGRGSSHFGPTLLFFVGGWAMGLVPEALALLTGYTLATGPLLADIGNDLKAGWVLRGFGRDTVYERVGQRQQLLAEWFGALLGIGVAYLFLEDYLGQGLLPPVVWIWEGVFQGLARGVGDWRFLGLAFAGGLLQLLSPGQGNLGIALAIGLIVANPFFGLALVGAAICKHFLPEGVTEFFDLGLVTGDGFIRALLLLFV